MKFSIRDLLWLTVVVALAVGLWIERRKTAVLTERVSELEQGYMGLKPGSYEIVPLNQTEDSTVKRFMNVEVTHESQTSAPNPPKD
jgi:hypothetical protein